ncbi:MAG: hypothetical protein JWN53_1366 [Gemmatimonadetes bacterium]|nr:hypothetical protein [Gemmatimonadota bacterium]
MRGPPLMTMSVVVAAIACAFTPARSQTSAANTLRPVSEFAHIADKHARSVSLFTEAGKVITSPRCMNCHPAGDRPTQTDARRPHQPWVVRGADGNGAPGLRCATCHHMDNFEAARVPGAPKWHLAPAAMAWQGKSLGQICRQIKDRSRNGNRDDAALLHHMAEDSLVGWGWHPGGGRTPAPGTQAEFGALIGAWLTTGGACPV